jgi:hypothetical protein
LGSGCRSRGASWSGPGTRRRLNSSQVGSFGQTKWLDLSPRRPWQEYRSSFSKTCLRRRGQSCSGSCLYSLLAGSDNPRDPDSRMAAARIEIVATTLEGLRQLITAADRSAQGTARRNRRVAPSVTIAPRGAQGLNLSALICPFFALSDNMRPIRPRASWPAFERRLSGAFRRTIAATETARYRRPVHSD